MKNKNVLITGANSFIGANLTKRLISKGFEVNALVRKTSDKWRLEGILNLKEYEVDLRARKKLFEVVNHINPDIIFHLATAGVYGGVFLSNDTYVINNFIGSMNLIDACNNIDYKCFINTGSSGEYGPKNTSMSEDMICTPTNMYGITKNAATKYGQMIAKTKEKPILSLRIFSPFGPLDHKERLISTATIKALQNQDIKLANPKIARDYIFIDDVVDLYIKSIHKANEFKGEIFNVGSGIQTTIYDVIQNIMQITKSKSKIQWGNYPLRNYDSEIWVADISKTTELLEWEPKHNLRQGLEKTVSWFKENLSIYE
jgi:nucleoside-diphosphate-sugar epimerase